MYIKNKGNGAQGFFNSDKVVEKSKPKRDCIIRLIKLNQNIEILV
ncbi:hypothetical protein OCHUTO_0002 [Orientia chuto str. Dubai]|uniref:Uncharacterized protein n=1 Tax=Orientia chuto str. Dubai TaxID=1359168 RepID=A0A0F3MP18_9RICK|nr:hypothetical protein OCHUTO_0002 [Orientia chuto str. Dubai]